MLILFDIDSTLVSTTGSGIRALEAAGRELFGSHFSAQRTEVAGRLDPLIIRELLTAHGQPDTHEQIELVRAGYRNHLGTVLSETKASHTLPGVAELLDRLAEAEGLALGLLTGNYPETGAMKLRACGIEPERFSIRVWGSDSPHHPPSRDHLPPVAIDMFKRRFNRGLPASHVTIIGDTPHDIRCAKVNGCRSLGVATGRYSVGDLERAGADLALADLTATEEVGRWLLRA